MGFYDAIRVGASGAAAATGYTVDRSLRFNISESTDLQRTPSSTGNQKVWTWSAWFKRWALHDNGGTNYLFSCEPHSGNNGIAALYIQSDQIYTYFDTTGSNPYGAVNERKYRDVGAWMHIVWQVDAANTSQRIWINGIEESLNSANNPPNYAYGMNQSGQAMLIGSSGNWGSQTSNIYYAEIHYSDGNKYEASDFAETDATTGQWVPKEVNISYGTNGFYLNFSDNSGTTATTLGKDSSGNGNNFTPNNFSVSAGDGNDSKTDTPTLNKATLNPLTGFTYNATLSEGNLKMSGNGGFKEISTIAVAGTSKLYYEVVNTSAGSWQLVGVFVGQPDNVSNALSSTPIWGFANTQATYFGGSYTSTSDVPSWTNNDVMGIKYENGSLKLYKNGTLATATTTSVPTSDIVFAYIANDNVSATAFARFSSNDWTQDSAAGVDATWELSTANLPDPTILLPNKHFAAFTYTGTGSSGDVVNITNSDVDFTPDWVWVKTRNVTNNHILTDSVRGGSKNLESNSTNAEQTDTDKIRAFIQNGFESGTDGDTNWPSRPFVAWNWNAGDTDGKTYTVKVVSDSGNKYRFDNFGTSAVTLDLAEGGTYIFDGSDSSMASHPIKLSETSNGTHGGGSSYNTGVTYLLDGASVTESAYISGYSSATTRQLKIVVATSAPTLYYYCHYHSGMGGAINTNSTLGSSNFDGSIQTTVKANQSAGFSIVLYEGQGSSDITLGHGLNAVPNVVLVKERTGTRAWIMYHSSLGANKYLQLATTQVALTNNDLFGNTTPTSSVFTVSDNGTSDSGDDYVAYCLSEVAGYSKFGSYIGNGSSDGTFVFTGFRVAWLMTKRTDSSSNWIIHDNKRDIDNVIYGNLIPNLSNTESTGSVRMDFLSNGFKHRNSDGGAANNISGGTYIYLAFAESPFKNARAR